MPVGGGGTRPGFETTRQATRQRTRRRRCGGRRRDQRAWPRCRWVAAGPGRASRSTTPSRRLACGDLAGGPPPTGTHSGRTPQSSPARQVRPDGARNTRGGHKQPGPAGSQERLRLGDLAARLAQGQAAVAVDGGTHVDEARARQERRVGAGAKLADGVQAFGGEAPSELGHEVGH